ncbi:MAG: nodulation protein NfeD [Deltaproteobacteria bacterium]|jgi:membrane-bound serine protease (ClpP class)|nr:nodulation protein NfeD [Deltaproteobacteria bacterium]
MMDRATARSLRIAAISLGMVVWFAGGAAAGHINIITIDGSINPASSDFLQGAIAQSESDGAEALLIELDTPGGLLSSTKDIIQAMLNAKVPVIVFVSPKGAWAASAGTFITLAGHVAAMAPGTSIGAASPISASGGGGGREEDEERSDVSMEKAEKLTMAFMESIANERKRNVEWAVSAVREAEAIAQDEALKLGVIDLVAADRADLLEQVHGMEIELGGEVVVLDLKGVEERTIEMTGMTKFFNFLASPEIAMLLVMAGLLGLYIEFQQPGMLVPGILGAFCLILAGFAFQILPFSWIGLLVMLVGMGFFILEIFVTSFGVLFTLGVICLLVGGTMIFDMPEVSDLTLPFWEFLVPVVAGFAVVAGAVVLIVTRSIFVAQTAGVDELLGQVGEVRTPLNPNGKVFIRGEFWSATADEEIASGERVEVTAVEGMSLRVRRAASRSRGDRDATG